jgi:hypothetical protein
MKVAYKQEVLEGKNQPISDDIIFKRVKYRHTLLIVINS